MKKIILVCGVLALLCAQISIADATQGDGISPNDIKEPTIDIVFVIDTTGSMSDEIREVKMHITNLIEDIQQGTPKPNVTIGFVLYRDYPDQELDYLSQQFLLTSTMDEITQFIEDIVAGGGGDYEETVTVGLDIAIHEMNWRPLVATDDGEQIIIGYDNNQNPIYASSNTSTKRMIILIGDAAPRTKPYIDIDGEEHTPVSYTTSIADAINNHIAIYTISGSGMDETGVAIWKELADQTGGEYEKLVYERKNIQDYVETSGLDEKWVERAKHESDYCAADATISTNNLGGFVRYAMQNEAESLGVRFTEEEPPMKHRQYLNTIGYLIDDDGDGIFTMFTSNITGTNTSVNYCVDGTYLIESNGDMHWDFVYNPATGQLSPYEATKTINTILPSMIILVAGCIIIVCWLIRKTQQKS